MCFSATASFTAAAVLAPGGVIAMSRAMRTDRRYVAISALPLLFGAQQLLEGLVWAAGRQGESHLVDQFSLGYMFFAWVVWPIWVPVAVYFLEPIRRKPIFLGIAIFGAMLGASQFFPYLAHDGWLVTTFFSYAISYGGTELFDLITGRSLAYVFYVIVVLSPLLMASNRHVNVFGALVGLVLVVTYFFFSFAYVSVFCVGAAIMSLYLVFMVFRVEPSDTSNAVVSG